MTQYDNTDTIALFKHDKKGNEKAPDYSGNLFDANGTKRRVAVWLRESQSGNKFMSGTVQDFQEQQAPPAQAAAQPVAESFDDIPF